jgi:hypothetical protein
MPGLTNLGIIHTAISLVAVGAGAVALIRDKEITFFLIGAALQVCRLRAENRPEPGRTIAPATTNRSR